MIRGFFRFCFGIVLILAALLLASRLFLHKPANKQAAIDSCQIWASKLYPAETTVGKTHSKVQLDAAMSGPDASYPSFVDKARASAHGDITYLGLRESAIHFKDVYDHTGPDHPAALDLAAGTINTACRIATGSLPKPPKLDPHPGH